MAGYTSQEMVDDLALRLEDENEDKFDQATKLSELNRVQTQLANLLHHAYLTEIQVKEFGLACSLQASDDEGSLAFSSLANTPLTNGIQQVRIAGGGAIAQLLEHDEARQKINDYNPGNNQYPKAYIYNERIYVAADDDTTSIDVWYLRCPVDMAAIFTIASFSTAPADITTPNIDARYAVADLGTPSPAFTVNEFVGQTGYNKTKSSNFIVYANDADELSIVYYDTDVTYEVGDELYFTSASANLTHLSSAQCELNPSLHMLVVDLAEAALWRHDGQNERASSIYQKAINEINALNARYSGEAPLGIGAGE